MIKIGSISNDRGLMLLVSASVLACAAIFSIGFFQSDEHFQILEFAAFKLGMIDSTMLPWEYEYKMRSAFQPLLAFVVHRAFGLIQIENPFFITTVLRFLSAGLSFTGMYLMYKVYCDLYRDGVLGKWFSYLSFFLWCSIFVGVRFSSEGWSGSLFVIGFSSYFLWSEPNRGKLFFVGLMFGLAYLCRYQVSLMIFGFCLWLLFVKREKINSLLLIVLGFLISVAMGLIIDRWYYGEWTWSFFNYIQQNIFYDKVSDFGVDPWWDYLLQVTLALIPPFSLIPILCFSYILFKKPKDVIIWTVLPFLIIHFIIGHKEIRFLFPLIAFIPVIVVTGLSTIQINSLPLLFAKKWVLNAAKVFFYLNLLLVIFVCTTSLDRTTPFYRYIYKNYSEPTTLYYIGKDPYKLGHLTYYKRPNLEVVRINSFDELPSYESGSRLIVVDKPGVLPEPANHNLVYSSIPGWVWYLNFNHWIERTLAWYLYEVPASTN